MEVRFFDVSKGCYFTVSNDTLIYLYCLYCTKETPQTLSSPSCCIVAVCAACCGERKFEKFTLCDKCGSFVEVCGFMTPRSPHKFLVVKDNNGLGNHAEKYIPCVVWTPSAINHICGKALDLQ